jgi:hypothetical protein
MSYPLSPLPSHLNGYKFPFSLGVDVCQFCKGQGPTGARFGDAVFCKVLEALAPQRSLVAFKGFIILYYIKYGITNGSSRKILHKRFFPFFFN